MLPASCRQLQAGSLRSPEWRQKNREIPLSAARQRAVGDRPPRFTAASDRAYSATHEAISVGYPAWRDRRVNGLLHSPTASRGIADHNCEPGPSGYSPLHPHTGRREKSGRLASHRSLPIVSRARSAGLFAETEIAVAGKRPRERGLARSGLPANAEWFSCDEQFRFSPRDRRLRIPLQRERGGKRDRTLEIAVGDQSPRRATQLSRLRETSHRYP